MGEFEGSCKKFVVSYDNLTMVNSPYTIEQDLKIHGHEEADTLNSSPCYLLSPRKYI